MKLPTTLGIRAKLILLFVAIKVVPLVLLALLAWEGVSRLGGTVAERTNAIGDTMREMVASLSRTVTDESEKALDDRSREAIEQLTTDTAREVAAFLYDRDRDVLLAAGLPAQQEIWQRFLTTRTHPLPERGTWKLSEDGKRWESAEQPEPGSQVTPENPENRQRWSYRPADRIRHREHPLYHEMTLIGLDGREKMKVSTSDLLGRDLKDVSRPANTYAKAETYWPALLKLKPGEIYVSEVIGPYVGSRVIGTLTPDSAKKAGVAFAPEKEAYAGKENPHGARFRGIVRWATPVVSQGRVTGYLTLALDHSHIMAFTDGLVPTADRFTAIPDASNGNYAFMWDHLDRAIAHPRHHSIVGFDPATGQRAAPWMDTELHERWQASGKSAEAFLREEPAFDGQSREKKPAKAQIKAGTVGLNCRYLNFAPQCQGWHNLTEQGGSGSFVILWSGLWKLTTAAAIPYYTGQYGQSKRGFGYVTIGANVDEFHKAATDTGKMIAARVATKDQEIRQSQMELGQTIREYIAAMARSLSLSTAIMTGVVVMIAIWLASLLTSRVTRINDGLRRIEQGDLGFRFERQSNDELGSLVDSLNRMAESVQQSFTRSDEARARAEEASAMKSHFIAQISHELRTPLTGILGFSEVLMLRQTDAKQRGYSERINQSAQRLLNLVNDLLDIAAIEAGRAEFHPQPVDLARFVDDVTGPLIPQAARKSLILRQHLAPDLPAQVVADPHRLAQILHNLLSNAVKFTHMGTVELRVKRRDNTHLLFEVADTGPGIAPEYHQQIFGRFTQVHSGYDRKHEGTGLGLAIVRELVELQGGEVGVESALGEGATFWFALPLLTGAAPAAPTLRQEEPAPA